MAWTVALALFALTAWLAINRKGRSLGAHPEKNQPEFVLDAPSNQAVGPPSLPAADTPPPEPKRPPNIAVRDWEHLVYAQTRLVKLNGPVDFYARAIDQHGQAIAGVKLSLILSFYNPNALKRLANYERDAVQEEQIELVSDGDGRFALSGKTGTTLRVEQLTKEGLYWSVWADPGLQSFDYRMDRNDRSPPYANRSQGAIFHLWEKVITERLVQTDFRVAVEPFGTNWYAVNLFRGSVQSNEVADFRFWFSTLTDSTGQPMRRFRFEAFHGGFVVDTNPYPYLAPTDGYASDWEWTYEPHGRDRTKSADEMLTKRFYFSARGGRVFAAITWRWASENSVHLTGFLNPTGSTNLEPDPAKQITDPEEIRRLDEETARGLRP